MRPILFIFAIVIALLACCDIEAAGPYNCGPNGCGPAYGSAPAARGRIFRRVRSRGPIRAIFARVFSRGC